jgi:hypothetical protein
MSRFSAIFRLLYICKDLLSEALTLIPLMARSRASSAAEILFLRKQLAFYQERKIKPRRFDDAARLSLLLFEALRLEEGSHQREARNIYRLAQESISAILALEVTRWKTTTAKEHTATDCRDGDQQSNVGTRASGR